MIIRLEDLKPGQVHEGDVIDAPTENYRSGCRRDKGIKRINEAVIRASQYVIELLMLDKDCSGKERVVKAHRWITDGKINGRTFSRFVWDFERDYAILKEQYDRIVNPKEVAT